MAKDHRLVGQTATRGNWPPQVAGRYLQGEEDVVKEMGPCEQCRPPGMTDQSKELSLGLLLKAGATGPELGIALPVQGVHRGPGRRSEKAGRT